MARFAPAACLAALAFALVPGRAPAAAPGAETYLRVCSSCHGEKGNGSSRATAVLRTPPRDFTTEEARTNLSREYMIAIVRDGRPHSAMVGRKLRLPQEEIEQVVDFIRAAFVPPEPGSDLAAGRDRYLASCASCHGDRGQGSAARRAPPLAAARARSGLTAEAMVEAILRQPHAPGQPLAGAPPTAAEAGRIVSYVRAAFIEAGALPRAGGAASR